MRNKRISLYFHYFFLFSFVLNFDISLAANRFSTRIKSNMTNTFVSSLRQHENHFNLLSFFQLTLIHNGISGNKSAVYVIEFHVVHLTTAHDSFAILVLSDRNFKRENICYLYALLCFVFG